MSAQFVHQLTEHKMPVKNIFQFHGCSIEQLDKLNTRHLNAILGSARMRAICSCGKGHHCGDSVLTVKEKEYNEKQRDLFKKVKQVMATREHLEDRRPPKKKEKKTLTY